MIVEKIVKPNVPVVEERVCVPVRRGDAGYTPVKGVDYFTAEEIAVFATKKELEKAKIALFVDMWEQACTWRGEKLGIYNYETGFFELNGLKDITYKQALLIYSETNVYKINVHNQFAYQSKEIRTNIPYTGYQGYAYYLYYGCKAEVLALYIDIWLGGTFNIFIYGLSELKKVIGKPINLSNYKETNNNFIAPILEDIKMIKLCSNINLSKVPKLNRQSILFLIDNATNAELITITLHKEAYDRLTVEDFAEASKRKINIAYV